MKEQSQLLNIKEPILTCQMKIYSGITCRKNDGISMKYGVQFYL